MPGSYSDDPDEQYILIAHEGFELEVDYARVFAAVSIHNYIVFNPTRPSNLQIRSSAFTCIFAIHNWYTLQRIWVTGL